MQKIKQLPAHEAQKIAAGEVVERPANAIKELIENALDAGATSITLLLKNAGSETITIIDNGCGMSAQDAHMCFKPFATSKISHVDELQTISTFGFRGEALTSIAAVSRISLITKEDSEEPGIEVHLDQGVVISQNSVSANKGTTFIIRELFFNVPARKKFLKSRETEWRHIQHIFYAFCFDYLDVHFTVEHDDRLIFNCPAVNSLTDRFAQLFDHHHAKNMIELQSTRKNSIAISGIISNHHYLRYDRSHIFVFVNKRWVKNHGLTKALIKGYNGSIPADRYPTACIFITLDPAEIDVNIHPRKEEIQFLHPRIIETLLQNAVKETLESALSSKLNVNSQSIQSKQIVPLQILQNKLPGPSIDLPTFPHATSLPEFRINEFPEPFVDLSKETTPETIVDVENSMLIGQLLKTYLLIEQPDGLFLIDQHAAHERILYERFSNRFESSAAVKLLFPIIIPLQREEILLLEPYLHLFEEHGIILDIFSRDRIIVQSTPVHAKSLDCAEFISSTLAWITGFQHLEKEQFSKEIHEKMRAQMACKSAVKAGDILNHEAMQQLLKDLACTPNRFSCPHGRPTGWLISLNEIEKKFRRKL